MSIEALIENVKALDNGIETLVENVKLLDNGIETARINNRDLGASVEAKLNDLIRQIEDTKHAFAVEIEERDRDLIRLREGAAQ